MPGKRKFRLGLASTLESSWVLSDVTLLRLLLVYSTGPLPDVRYSNFNDSSWDCWRFPPLNLGQTYFVMGSQLA